MFLRYIHATYRSNVNITCQFFMLQMLHTYSVNYNTEHFKYGLSYRWNQDTAVTFRFFVPTMNLTPRAPPLPFMTRHARTPLNPLWCLCFGITYISPTESLLCPIFLWTQGLEKSAPWSSSRMRCYHTNLQRLPDVCTLGMEDGFDVFYRHRTRKKFSDGKDVRRVP